MIINNINGFEIKIDDEVLDSLKYVDADDVVECLKNTSRENIDNGWVRDDIFECSSYEIYYYSEADEEIENAESYDDILEAAEISGALENFDGDIDDFKFKIGQGLVWVNVNREIGDIIDNIKILDGEDEPFEFEELSVDIQEKIREDLYDEFICNWSDAEFWREYYNDSLPEKHYILNNLKVLYFQLDGCQSDYIDLIGHINIEDLKKLIDDYGFKIFHIFKGYASSKDWNYEDQKLLVETINKLNDNDRVELEEDYDYNHFNNAILYSSEIDLYDYRGCLVERFVRDLVHEISMDLLRDAKNDINNFIDANFEFHLEMYVEDYLFTEDGEPVDRY